MWKRQELRGSDYEKVVTMMDTHRNWGEGPHERCGGEVRSGEWGVLVVYFEKSYLCGCVHDGEEKLSAAEYKTVGKCNAWIDFVRWHMWNMGGEMGAVELGVKGVCRVHASGLCMLIMAMFWMILMVMMIPDKSG